ncbi:hypothetical protein L915_02315 [Phytophthora nicotianae]|uniref:Uncharacterized protein n=1 Tax=Phytophthora nicotianae TaxID=4792 RepID=W2HJL0_PHYNI|nr:hypothetical protein L915_02315 [Phytophthora nicotianae]
MTSGYTENYFFEIDGGIVSMKHLVTTPDEDVQRHSLIGCGDAGTIRRAFLRDLFGRCDLDSATARDVTLPRQPLLSLPTRKLTSLSLKYFSIPAQYLDYFPPIQEAIEELMIVSLSGRQHQEHSLQLRNLLDGHEK